MARNLFNSIKLSRPRTNMFELTHDHKLSCQMGQLVPIMAVDCVPGDRVRLTAEAFTRFAPMIAPMMHRVDQTIHYFFVPYRLLWDGWEQFITNSPDPNLPAFPTLVYDGAAGGHGTATPAAGGWGKLDDHLGIPPAPVGAINPEKISAMFHAAYQCVYNEYYRDQNNQPDPIEFALINGSNDANTELKVLRNRAWEHDYFTSALPFAQKGSAVSLPLGNVELKANWSDEPGNPNFQNDTFGPALSGNIKAWDYTTDNPPFHELGPGINTTGDNTGPALAYDPAGTLEVGATTINDLRRAFRLQEWLEKAARGGSRYVENIFSFFGIKSPDARLNRPEYITGTKAPVVVSEVLNTTGTDDLPQGNMAGHAVSVTSGNRGSYFCQEHGVILGIMSVMPKTAYQQGIDRKFSKFVDPFQYFWPQFANIGEQEIQNREIYAFQGTTGADTFGYVPRYAEYKFENNRVSGDFRTTLNYWTMSRIFAGPPALNEDFIVSDPTTRIFAVEDPNTDHLYCHILNKLTASRPMPKYGIPTF